MKIIGYFHVCQKGEWERSFDMIFNYIKNYGLYDQTTEIRVGVINDENNIIPNYRLEDSKFRIMYYGNSALYERPTLLHMKTHCTIDSPDTVYWYLHTKGLRHFSTEKESFVIDWIKLMLYWNTRKWNIALEKLQINDTYGCNMFGKVFYSGNFWWATSKHITYLPSEIEDYYTAPEDWILRKCDNYCQIYSSGIQGEGHYNYNFPEINYMSNEDLNRNLPMDFYIDTYKVYHPYEGYSNEDYINDYFINGVHTNINYVRSDILNVFLHKLPEKFNMEFYKNKYSLYNYSTEQIITHWFSIGAFENSIYNIPEDFDYTFYRSYYKDLSNLTDDELIIHWHNHGSKENRYYKNMNVAPCDFNFNLYRNNYSDLKDMDDNELVNHWFNHGIHEGRVYNRNILYDNFNYDLYRNNYNDLKNLNNEELLEHWINHGEKESRVHTRNILYDNFNCNFYRNNYSDLKDLSDEELLNHWINCGIAENRICNYNLPSDFNYMFYRKYYRDLNNMSDEELANHWMNNGILEGRIYK